MKADKEVLKPNFEPNDPFLTSNDVEEKVEKEENK